MSSFLDVYRGRRVLVTGHTGFKGSWLTTWLLELGAEVTGYAIDVPTVPSHFEACGLARRIHHVVGDVRDAAQLSDAIERSRAEIVFHLAAQSLVRRSYAQPVVTFETNLLGSVNMLEAVRRFGDVRCLIYVTSDKCYENCEQGQAYREEDVLGGTDPYAASKACAELAFSAYSRSFFPRERLAAHRKAVASVRAGNVLGGGDWSEDRLVPDCVRALAARQEVVLRHPEAIRPWQHVLECLSGYLWLGALLWTAPERHSAEAWNFGPSSSTSRTVRELTECLIASWGGGRWRALDQRQATEGEHLLLHLDAEKAKARLCWHTCLSFEEMVRWVAAWYRGYYDDPEPGRSYARSVEQIEGYTELARRCELPWAGAATRREQRTADDRRRVGSPA